MHRNRSQEADTIAATHVEFDDDTDTFRTEFDCQTRLPTEAVIAAVSAAKDVDETALPSLFESIDPDALDTIFVTRSPRTRHRQGTITFEYAGCQIVVNSHGTVIVDPCREIEVPD